VDLSDRWSPPMCKRARLVLATLALLVLALGSPVVGLAQSPADIAAARELFQEGTKLSRQGEWEQALDRFVRSLALKRASITLYSLGVAQKNTGRLAEALESFRAFLAAPSEPSTQPFESPAREAVAELDGRVAHVTIVIAPDGLSNLAVAVDGAAVPSIALDHARLLNPGHHTIRVSADGHDAAERELTLAEGDSTTVAFTLTVTAPHAASTVSARRREEPPPAPEAVKPFPTVPVTLMAGGAAALGVGLAVGLVGVGEAGDAPTSDGPEAKAARSKAIAGDVVGAAGIAAAGIGLILLLVDLGSEDGAGQAAGLVHCWRTEGRRGIELRF
jgi:hypothetical protein